MSRTVKESLKKRLETQAQEASVQGLTKVAANVQHAVKEAEVRPDDDTDYTYSQSEVSSDIEKPLWQAVVRAADFYDCHVDAADMQTVIEKMASELMKEVRNKGGVKHGVGAYEPAVPGELSSKATIEVG